MKNLGLIVILLSLLGGIYLWEQVYKVKKKEEWDKSALIFQVPYVNVSNITCHEKKMVKRNDDWFVNQKVVEKAIVEKIIKTILSFEIVSNKSEINSRFDKEIVLIVNEKKISVLGFNFFTGDLIVQLGDQKILAQIGDTYSGFYQDEKDLKKKQLESLIALCRGL